MKKIFIALLGVFMFSSCQKTGFEIQETNLPLKLSDKYTKVYAQAYVNESAVRFWNNFKELAGRLVVIEHRLNLQSCMDNFLWKDLETIRIIVDGEDTHFSALDMEDKLSFLEEYAETEALFFSYKMTYAPELACYFDAVSDIMEKTVLSELLPDKMFDLADILRIFKTYQVTLISLQEDAQVNALVKLTSSDYEPVPVERIRSCVKINSPEVRFGDLFVTSPLFDSPTTVVNIVKNGAEYSFKPGHTETYVADIDSERPIFGATATSGNEIGYNRLEDWIFGKSYILRLVAKQYEKQPDGSFQAQEQNININDYLTVLKAQSVKPYCKVVDDLSYVKDLFTTMLDEPESFTCSALVWYAAKQAYDFNLSGLIFPIITPTGIIMDDNTMIIGTIE